MNILRFSFLILTRISPLPRLTNLILFQTLLGFIMISVVLENKNQTSLEFNFISFILS